MGLCKCPKKKVTNLFCCEHRVNVCENCMVKNHPKCIVLSYLCWLKDSDYNSICLLCNKDLASDDCIRLICYHVFHWACLDHYARQLPETTAPAGYVCPSCKEPIFPKPKLVSEVAAVLREKISSVNWARAGLGLPLLTEDSEVKSTASDILVMDNLFSNGVPLQTHSSNDKVDTVVHMDENFSRSELPDMLSGIHSCTVQAPRRTFHGMENLANTFLDDDDNKYRRRTPSDWFNRWTKSFWSKIRFYRGPRRSWIFLLFLITILCFAFVILSSFGHIVSIDDSSNANINFQVNDR